MRPGAVDDLSDHAEGRTIEIRRLESGFALEVMGLPLWEPFPEATLETLAEHWSQSGLLIFRRQALSEDEIVAFSARFGELDVIVRKDWQSSGRPEVIHISNLKDGAGRSIGGLGAGEIGWHSDQSYMRDPATGSLLYMVEGASGSGRTYWAHLGRAYASLPDATKAELEGKHAIFDYRKRQSTYDDDAPMSEELHRNTPVVAHPLVNRHPISHTASLYLDPTTTVGIRELPGPRGEALLERLIRHATRPELVYTHEWQVGDVVMWDNGVVMHRRDPIDPTSHRLLKRTTFRLAKDRHIVPPGVEVAAPYGEDPD
jgi:taurine dioxygenase